MKLFGLLLILGVTASCAALHLGVKHSHQESGKEIYEAKCNSTHYSIGDCRRQASKVCNGKFSVVGSESVNTGSYNTASATNFGSTAQASGYSVNGLKRSMMFYCTGSETADLKRLN
jgi:hypothetical protein